MREGKSVNHDCTHCADYKQDCPQTCLKAQLMDDLESRPDLWYVPLSWAHFWETAECMRKDGDGK